MANLTDSFDDIFAEAAAEKAAATTNRGYQNEPFDKERWAEQKQNEREALYAMLEQYAESIDGSGENLQTYLTVQSRFDRYSVGNSLLIAAQMPKATRLADYTTWQAANLYVRKGESSIAILEPGAEYERADGSIGVNYNVKKVFDISQTNAPKPAAPAASYDERLLLKGLIKGAPCTMQISDDLPEGINVQYLPEEQQIHLRRGLPAAVIFRGLAQELARAHLANMDKTKFPAVNPAFSAYCVSYMLCCRYGMGIESFSFARLPEQYADMEGKDIRQDLSTMREVFGEINTAISREIAEQTKANARGQAWRNDGEAR